MKQIATAAILLVLVQSVVWADRLPAPTVDAVMHDGVRYVVPNDKGLRGYVQAWDVKTGEKLWEKTIFRVRRKPFFPLCVRSVFIKGMVWQEDKLAISDERGKHFSLDPKTRTVVKVKTTKKSEAAGQGKTEVRRLQQGPPETDATNKESK